MAFFKEATTEQVVEVTDEARLERVRSLARWVEIDAPAKPARARKTASKSEPTKVEADTADAPVDGEK